MHRCQFPIVFNTRKKFHAYVFFYCFSFHWSVRWFHAFENIAPQTLQPATKKLTDLNRSIRNFTRICHRSVGARFFFSFLRYSILARFTRQLTKKRSLFAVLFRERLVSVLETPTKVSSTPARKAIVEKLFFFKRDQVLRWLNGHACYSFPNTSFAFNFIWWSFFDVNHFFCFV